MLSFPLFALTTVHALNAGSDRQVPALRWSIVVGIVAVTGLTFHRVHSLDRGGATPPKRSRTAMTGPAPTTAPTAKHNHNHQTTTLEGIQ